MYRNLTRRTTGSILTILVALCLCAAPASAAKKAKYAAGAVSNGGTIKGTIKAAAKADETFKITKDNKLCGDSIAAQKYIIGGDGGVKNAVVKLEGITAGKDWASKDDPVMTNKDCFFVPHVMVARKAPC